MVELRHGLRPKMISEASDLLLEFPEAALDPETGGVSKYRFELNKKFCESSTKKPDIDNQPNNDVVHLMRF